MVTRTKAVGIDLEKVRQQAGFVGTNHELLANNIEAAMKRKKEAGQALIITALALVVLLGFAGLAVDMGVMRYEKRLQQNAADAAAIAGASNLKFGGIVSGGQAASATNGFADNAGGQVSTCSASGAAVGTTCVQINNPPASGPHTNDPNYVEALVSAVHSTYFMKILNINSETITARAVATNTSGGPYSGCLYTLGPPSNSIEGININGAATLNATSCGILDNGDFNTKGNKLVVNAQSFGESGSTNASGPGGTVTCQASGPCPAPGMPAASDPLAGIAPPCTSCGTGTTIKITGGSCSGTGCGSVSCSGGACTIQPGNYSSITIGGSGGTPNVTFAAGNYIIDGGGSNNCSAACLNVPANAIISGNGVMFYFTNSSTANITGTPTINLTAPSSGTYAGILMYQDPADTNKGPAPQGPTLGGNSGSSYDGVLYFPSDELTFYGNANSTNCSDGFSAGVVIANSFSLSGHPTVCLQGQGGLPPGVNLVSVATLVE